MKRLKIDFEFESHNKWYLIIIAIIFALLMLKGCPIIKLSGLEIEAKVENLEIRN